MVRSVGGKRREGEHHTQCAMRISLRLLTGWTRGYCRQYLLLLRRSMKKQMDKNRCNASLLLSFLVGWKRLRDTKHDDAIQHVVRCARHTSHRHIISHRGPGDPQKVQNFTSSSLSSYPVWIQDTGRRLGPAEFGAGGVHGIE